MPVQVKRGRVSDASNHVWLLLTVVAAVAFWIDLGRLHEHQYADSLIPILVSLQRWTPFYWGQDRFGMLVPLVSLPFRDPMTNLLVQGWLTTVLALLAPFLLARYFNDEHWFATGAVANALVLCIASPIYQFEWFVAQPYGVSIALAFAGLLLLRRDTRAALVGATFCLALAHWENLGIAALVLPAAIVTRSHRVRTLVATSCAVGIGIWLSHSYDGPPTETTVLAVSQWPHSWMALIRTTIGVLRDPLWSVLVVAIGIGLAFTKAATGDNRSRRRGLVVLTVALFYWLMIGTFRHVQLNDYFPRYVLPAQVLITVAASSGYVALLKRRVPAATALAVTLLVLSAAAIYGVPSKRHLRTVFDRKWGWATGQVLATHAHVIAGNYWTVWPTVFHANLVLSEQGHREQVFGLAYRSEPTDARWLRSTQRERVLIAARDSDNSARQLVDELGVPYDFVGNVGNIALFAIEAGPTVPIPRPGRRISR